MCGIAGTFGFVDQKALDIMAGVQHSRGPDDRATFISSDGQCGLAFNRLAIVDPAHGQQPLTDGEFRTAICNGEIYNHTQLRQELTAEYGARFYTGSDAEVIPHLDRVGSLARLDGMFAAAVHDSSRRGRAGFCGIRDRYGIKPFWYIHKDDPDGGWWWFASEPRALFAAGADVSRIRRLAPGHVLSRTGERAYYRLTPAQVPSVDDTDLLHALLDTAVRRHLMADVPIGVFLSGGLDSSVVAALAAAHYPDLTAFTVGLPGSPDVEAARVVAEHLGLKHVIVDLDLDELEQGLPDAVVALQTYNPMYVVEGAVQQRAAHVAREHGIVVMLCGEGADELFMGYGVFRGMVPDEAVRQAFAATAQIGDTECMRVDRACMAEGVEARPVFLDPMVVEYALNLPYHSRLRYDGTRLVEKWALRKLAERLLPPEIAWRPKGSIDDVTGALDVLGRIRAQVPTCSLTWAQNMHPHANLRTPEAAYFYRCFTAEYGDMGGPNVFKWFGSYPLLDEVIATRDLTRRGTGEPVG